VRLRERASARGEPLPQEHLDRVFAHQPDPERLRQPLPGDVVLRRAQTARDDEHVGPVERLAEDAGDAVEVVPHRRVVEDVDPDLCQALGDVAGVVVRDLAEQDLRSHADDLGPHPAAFSREGSGDIANAAYCTPVNSVRTTAATSTANSSPSAHMPSGRTYKVIAAICVTVFTFAGNDAGIDRPLVPSRTRRSATATSRPRIRTAAQTGNSP